jgi:hypothetical protein
MKLKIDFDIPLLKEQIKLEDKIMLVGSCFTENMGEKLTDRMFNTYQNPHGIIFNPVSVWSSMRDVLRQQVYTADHLFQFNEQWHSWSHHSKFSGNRPEEALQKMNTAIIQAHQFLQQSKWLIITLGSAFAYRHNALDMHVSNNHKAPAPWFTKELLDLGFMQPNLQKMVDELIQFNPQLNIIFTISPVRHLRDGVINNNRSKARLVEVVHAIVNTNPKCHYFPSYEIVIDELRDYRFYDIDFAHPNYLATQYVWEHFVNTAIDNSQHELLEKLYKITLAKKHKSFNPNGIGHQNFLKMQIEICVALQKECSFLSLSPILNYFTSQLI